MKASTFFGLTVALLFALAAGVVARVMGVFDTEPAAQVAPVAETPVVDVVVARKNIYAGIGVNSSMVAIQQVPADDPEYLDKQDQLVGTLAAAFDRIPQRNIAAGEFILDSDLSEQAFPEVPTPPEGKVAVNISVPTDRAHGGLIRRGQHVDVMLTSRIHTTDDTNNTSIKSAIIARNAEVLTVRNRIMEMIEFDRPGRQIPFTLAVSPFRAALIEQAKLKGTISLHLSQVPASEPTSDELEKDRLVLAGKHSVGDEDFAEVFNLEPIEVPEPPAPPPAPPVPPAPPEPPRPVPTRHFIGVDQDRVDLFDLSGKRVEASDEVTSAAPQVQPPEPEPTPVPVPVVVGTPNYVFGIPEKSGRRSSF